MARLVAVESITLDGVMQAPGRPDEDTRGGFEHGGWAIPYNDEVMGQEMGKRMAQGGPLVLGSGQRLSRMAYSNDCSSPTA